VDDTLHDLRISVLMKLIKESTQVEERKRFGLELNDFLRNSSRYNLSTAKTSLEDIRRTDGSETLVTSQTTIYRKLNLHNEAVTLLLSANKAREAEAYAKEVSDESRRSGKQADAFRYLLTAMLKKGEASPEAKQAAEKDVLALIASNPQMDAIAALEVLPEKTKVADIKNFLVNALRSSDALARNQMVRANLLKATLRSLDIVAAVHKSASVRLTRDTKCEVCQRAIGASIFLRFPDGYVAHHGCALDKQVSPKTGRDFARNVELL
jgi:hypothetical protein